MEQHKYRVGELVDYTAARLGVPASAKPYEIVRLLPREGTDRLYRIKCAAETFERVAKERELARGTSL